MLCNVAIGLISEVVPDGTAPPHPIKAQAPLFVCALGRPSFGETRKSFGERAARQRRPETNAECLDVDIAPLGNEEMAQLVNENH